MLISMRQTLVLKWIKEVNIEIEKAKKEINLYKLVPEMDYQLELVLQNPIPNQKLLLDCQSFVNGLVKLEYIDSIWENVGFFMLAGNDCDEAAQFGLKAQEESLPYCLKLNFEKFNLELSYDLSKCESPE